MIDSVWLLMSSVFIPLNCCEFVPLAAFGCGVQMRDVAMSCAPASVVPAAVMPVMRTAPMPDWFRIVATKSSELRPLCPARVKMTGATLLPGVFCGSHCNCTRCCETR